jgi:hypothetical protein
MEEANMVAVDFPHILRAARQLPKPSHAKPVSALLQAQGAAHPPTLEPLTGLSAAELCALATSVLAPAPARRLKQLLRLHRQTKVTHALQAALEALLEDSDRIALVKAKAHYTLSLMQA